MDRDFLVAFVGCVVVTYASRIAGFYAGNREMSLRTQNVLAYVPIGAFTAIVTPGLTEGNGELDSRIPAMIVAGFLAYRSKPLWVCLVVGFALYLGFKAVTT